MNHILKKILTLIKDYLDSTFGNVENKSSATIRSEITKKNVTDALGYAPISESLIGNVNGVAELDENGQILSSQLPSYVDDVIEGTISTFPTIGESGKIYLDTDTNVSYRWSGSTYVEIGSSIALGETSSTAYRGDRGKIAYDHSQSTHTIAQGGTGATTAKGAQNNLLSDMNETTTALDDNSLLVFKYSYPNASTGTIFSKKAPLVWDYIKNKISSVLGLTATSYSGNAASATKVNGHTVESDVPSNAVFTDTVYTHPSYTARTGKPTANQTPAFGGTATVSQITSDATGHVTAATDRTITIPSTLSNGTDTAGLIKTTSTVTSNSGYTACPVISGVPYYKDTNTTYSNLSLGQGYGTCSTTAATTAKVVSMTSYALVAGGVVSVKFTYAVPANATMNINSKGAKPIYYKGAAITAGIIDAGDIATFMYTGSYYYLLTIDNIQSLKKSVADGKALLASTISEYVDTASDATFEVINDNIIEALDDVYADGKAFGYTEGYSDGVAEASISNDDIIILTSVLDIDMSSGGTISPFGSVVANSNTPLLDNYLITLTLDTDGTTYGILSTGNTSVRVSGSFPSGSVVATLRIQNSLNIKSGISIEFVGNNRTVSFSATCRLITWSDEIKSQKGQGSFSLS